ncbi:MAG: DUF4249 domain-containing protein [Prevotella sp.]|nr:DUF4249 domain-containing protein [Prevotella sp.]
MRKILYLISPLMALAACTKEIDFDYHEVEPLVVIEGLVTDEGTSVVVTRSRSVSDPLPSPCRKDAVVTITCDGKSTVIPYDAKSESYCSPMAGVAGKTYQLDVDLDGRHYEASAYMPPPATILAADFFWMSVVDERMLVYELWALDPDPSERTHFWYRMDRISHHPHFEGKTSTEPYRWGVLDDRGCPPGKVFIDMMATSEKAMDKDEEDDWDYILYDGDSITCRLMTIDRPVYDYFSSLRAGQRGGANPQSNISGGCLGYFAAGSVSRTDTIVFQRSRVKEWQKAE